MILLLACSHDEPAPAPTRVNAVTAAPAKTESPEQFCEQRASVETAKRFAFPTLDGPPPAETAGRWTWVNVWATWCAPCIEEMPMLARWKDKLATEGVTVDLHFLSVDAKADEVSRFYDKNPHLPASVRMKDQAELATWLGSVGLDATAVLPVHFFVDPEDRIRCVRMGSVGEPDYATVKRVLAG